MVELKSSLMILLAVSLLLSGFIGVAQALDLALFPSKTVLLINGAMTAIWGLALMFRAHNVLK